MFWRTAPWRRWHFATLPALYLFPSQIKNTLLTTLVVKGSHSAHNIALTVCWRAEARRLATTESRGAATRPISKAAASAAYSQTCSNAWAGRLITRCPHNPPCTHAHQLHRGAAPDSGPSTVLAITVVWALQELHSANEAQRALWSSSWLPHISAPSFHPKPVAPSPAKVPRRIQLDPGAVGMYAVTGVRTLSNHGSVTATSCHTHSLTCHVDITVRMPIYLHAVLTSQDLLGLWNPSPYCTSRLPAFNHRP